VAMRVGAEEGAPRCEGAQADRALARRKELKTFLAHLVLRPQPFEKAQNGNGRGDYIVDTTATSASFGVATAAVPS
jgi:hypothetical protein